MMRRPRVEGDREKEILSKFGDQHKHADLEQDKLRGTQESIISFGIKVRKIKS